MLFFLALGLNDSFAQRYLILQKGGNQKSRIKYEEGDFITYRPQGFDYFLTDQIKEITREYLILTENIISPEKIAAVNVSKTDERNRTIRGLSTLTASAGVLLLVTETINGLYHEGNLEYSKGGLIISSSLFVSSFVLSKLKKRYFKNQGRNKIQIIYLDIDNIGSPPD